MIYRLLNIILIIPCALFGILFYALYPVLGYILGRGFQHSINDVNDLNVIVLYEGAIEYIKALFNLLLKGGVK